MKENWRNSLLFVVLLIAGACGKPTAEDAATYTCPMHPSVVADAPGTCPLCGMDLVRTTRHGEETEITRELAPLLKSPNEAVIASIKTIRPEFKSVVVTAEATGTVTYDPRKLYTIPARIGGRMEKVYLRYEFQKVKKGQKVADIYSPELITAQREFLYLLANDSENEALVQAATTRLQLLGMQDFQIRDLQRRGAVVNTFSIHSPYDGFVISNGDGQDLASASTEGVDGAGQGARGTATLVREGDYVAGGQTLFRIANTSAMRISLDIPASWSAMIHEGDTVELNLDNGAKQTATIDLVQPFFNASENFMRVRVYTHDASRLHVGQLVDATVSLGRRESLWLPKESVIDLGLDKVAFVREGAVMRPKIVMTGITSGNEIEIRSGLVTSDEVAANAQFLTGSESFIKP